MRLPIPLHSVTALLLALVTFGCSEEEKTPDEMVATSNESGDFFLGQGRVNDARKAYESALAVQPGDTHAAFGAALTTTLLLPDTAPVNELLDLCRQPHIGMDEKIYGPTGILAQEAVNRGGSGTFAVKSQSSASAPFVDTGFRPNRFRTSYNAEGGYLNVYLYQTVPAGQSGGGSYSLSLSASDLYSDDAAVVTPLTSGMVIDLGRVSSSVNVGDRYSAGTFSGTAVFRGELGAGKSIQLEFNNATVASCRRDGNPCTESFQLSGTVDDKIDPPALANPLNVPFFGTRDEAGPPQRDALIVAIDSCGSTLSTDLFTSKLLALSVILDQQVGRLETALAGGAQDFSFTVPKGLLYSEVDLPLNGTDALLLRGALRTFSTVFKLVAAYRYTDGPAQGLIGNFNYWYGSPAASYLKRHFVVSTVAANLGTHLFTRAAGFDLAPIQSGLDLALTDFSGALRLVPTKTGIFNFQRANSQPFAAQTAEQLDLIRSSLSSGSPVAFARNPLYRLHLQSFFANPLDRARLISNSGLTSLVRLVPGVANAVEGSERNDSLQLETPADDVALEQWLGGLIDLPAPSAVACETPAVCPAGYGCSGSVGAPGVCSRPTFQPVEQAAIDDLGGGTGYPSFIDSSAVQLIESWR